MPQLNWDKLVPYDRTQHRSFEELCYQIATVLHEHEGRFTSIDDSGGGDGVEFFLTLPNGEQWGWQAKFYFPDGRLEPSRKTSIKESLQKSCEQHPKLTRWLLCTPRNLTVNEQSWFDEVLPTSTVAGRPVIPVGRSIELLNWTESDFIGWMSEESFAGTKLYFFGELELTQEWFKLRFEKQLAGVREKFDPSLHTQTHVDEHIHQLLGDKRFIMQFEDVIHGLRELHSRHLKHVARLRSPKPQSIDWQNSCGILLAPAEEVQKSVGEMLVSLELTLAELVAGDWRIASDHDWEQLQKRFEASVKVYRAAVESIKVDELRYLGEVPPGGRDDGESNARRAARQTLRAPAESAVEFIEALHIATDSIARLKQSDHHIWGRGGFGKTHLACHIIQERIEEGLPALLVLGKHFTTDEPLEQQLLSILDIPKTYSWHDFLAALDSVASVYRTRVPIFIDGLNEAAVGGPFSGVWKRGLPGLIVELSALKSVVVVTTCRTSYQAEIWGPALPENSSYANGFESANVRDAVERYFRAYKIKADLTAAPLNQFRHPIYLKIYCEVENPERRNEKQVYVGEQSLFATFDAFLDHCNKAVCSRLGLRPDTPVATDALNKFAAYLWKRSTRQLSINDAAQLIDGKPLADLVWSKSKTQACESEGLLVCRDWSDEGEEFFFTYDLLGGYLIARSLLESHASDFETFLNSERTMLSLYSDDYALRHPLHEDIRRSLAALLPVKRNRYLHNIIKNNVAFDDSVDALFEIDPVHVDDSCSALISELFSIKENRMGLLELSVSTFAHPGHPLNVRFWNERLKALPMNERDESWTELVRDNVVQRLQTLREFEERCRRQSEIVGLDKERIDLLALGIVWLLTSTVRQLRDRATRSLYWYGRRFPESFLEMLLVSFEINDPFVRERTLAAGYGIAMARHSEFGVSQFVNGDLPKWARTLYERMFAPMAPNSTTHILMRDFARRTIEIALLHQPDLLTEAETKRLRPPYAEGGIRQWGERDDRNKGEYRNGNAPLGNDFENYTLGRLVEDRQNYDYEHAGFKKVRANIHWRIYDLGYSLERFGSIDQAIASQNWNRDNNPNQVERYGKKYSWIAYFELAGYLYDQGLLARRFKEFGHERIADVDLDPSFPEKVPDYRLVRESYLGSDESSTQDWIRDGGVPDVSEMLVVRDLMEHKGAWVLLDGHSNQDDRRLDRNRFTFIRTLLLTAESSVEITSKLAQQDMKGRWLPEIPENHYLFAGEIPWSELYFKNDWSVLEFSNTRQEAGKPWHVEHKSASASDASPQSESVSSKILELLKPKVPHEEDHETSSSGIPLPSFTFGVLQQKGNDSSFNMEDNASERIEGNALPETPSVLSDLEIGDEVEAKVLVPLQTFGWESYHSVVNDAGRVEVLARQLADALDLRSRPQTFDLFDSDGNRASVTWKSKNERDAESFLYIRRDLLDTLLAKENLKLVWVTWGERQYSVENMSNRIHSVRGRGELPYRAFQEVRTYPNCVVQTPGNQQAK